MIVIKGFYNIMGQTYAPDVINFFLFLKKKYFPYTKIALPFTLGTIFLLQ